MDVTAGIMEEDLEVTHNSIPSLPTTFDSAQFRNLDPALTRSTNPMMDVYPKRESGCRNEANLATISIDHNFRLGEPISKLIKAFSSCKGALS